MLDCDRRFPISYRLGRHRYPSQSAILLAAAGELRYGTLQYVSQKAASIDLSSWNWPILIPFMRRVLN